MGEPIRLAELRARAERMGGVAVERGDGKVLGWDISYGHVARSEVLALVDAVEAAHALSAQRVAFQSTDAWAPQAQWDALTTALARFDLGGADGQPTTTKGGDQ